MAIQTDFTKLPVRLRTEVDITVPKSKLFLQLGYEQSTTLREYTEL